MISGADSLDIPYLAVAFGEHLPLSWVVEHTRGLAARGPTDPIHRAWRESKSPGKMLTMLREQSVIVGAPTYGKYHTETVTISAAVSRNIVHEIPGGKLYDENFSDIGIQVLRMKRAEPTVMVLQVGPGLAMSHLVLKNAVEQFTTDPALMRVRRTGSWAGNSERSVKLILRAIRNAVLLSDVLTLKEVLETR